MQPFNILTPYGLIRLSDFEIDYWGRNAAMASFDSDLISGVAFIERDGHFKATVNLVSEAIRHPMAKVLRAHAEKAQAMSFAAINEHERKRILGSN